MAIKRTSAASVIIVLLLGTLAISLLTTSIVSLPGTKTAYASSPNLVVKTEAQNGSLMTGYWVEVTTAAGAMVQGGTGFSTAQFVLPPGNYLVGVSNYEGTNFAQWSDGSTDTFHAVVVNSTGTTTLVAIYSTPGGGGKGNATITVNSAYSNGTSLNGMYTIVQQNGLTVATGFTPAKFNVSIGQFYSVTVDDYVKAYFDHWSTGITSRTFAVVTANTSTTLMAYYLQALPPPPTNSITVTSNLLNGTSLAGFFVDLRINGTHIESGFTPVTFKNLQPGVQYGVVVYWFGNYYFRHFADGNLNRYALVTLNGTGPATVNALYEYVPQSRAASLDILAEFPNGTLIGNTEVIGGYIYHAPGMWLDVIPPNQTAPFTGTFTGGSILPFVFFTGESYTVEMTLSYAGINFSHWQDNNSPDNIRAFTMYENATYTYVAIYNA